MCQRKQTKHVGLINTRDNDMASLLCAANPDATHKAHRMASPLIWLGRFMGNHPPQIESLINDLTRGAVDLPLRPTGDIESLLGSARYPLITVPLDHGFPLRCAANWLPRPARRAVKAALSH